MTVSKAQFIWGIRQQESGGNYSATNSIGATGAYQVLKSNIASWSQKALGHSVSYSQFLSSPSIQDAVVDSILGGYYDTYGPEGAAAMWYSGQPDPNKTYGSPSVRSYVDSVIQHATQAPAGVSLPLSGSQTGTGSGTTTTATGGTATATQAGLLSFPGDVVSFFKTGLSALESSVKFLGLFFQPSTYVRIGAGAGGALFLIVGIVCLGLSAAEKG